MNANYRREVDSLIDAYIAGQLPDKHQIRELVAQRRVLPAYYEWSAFGGIFPDGTAAWVDYDSPNTVAPIAELRIQRMMLFRASKLYPSLSGLCPQRPPNATTCRDCAGKGNIVVKTTKKELEFGCYCGGLGWLLEWEQNTV